MSIHNLICFLGEKFGLKQEKRLMVLWTGFLNNEESVSYLSFM